MDREGWVTPFSCYTLCLYMYSTGSSVRSIIQGNDNHSNIRPRMIQEF